LSPNTDWFSTAVSVDESGIQILEDWSNDYETAIETLYRFRSPKDGDSPYLFDLIDSTFDKFDYAELPSNLQKAIVLFSDGVDRRSARSLIDVAQKAIDRNIKIHAVLIGPPNFGGGQENMQRLAALTGGQFQQLARASDLDLLWNSMAIGRNQRVISYRSTQPRPETITVVAYLPDGTRKETTRRFPPLRLQPVTIQISQLISHTFVITRQGNSIGASLEALEPQTINIPLNFEWPDGHQRYISSITYKIGNNTQTIKTAPFDEIAVDISSLDTGSYSLNLEVSDELGVVGKAEPLLAQIYTVPPTNSYVLFLGGAVGVMVFVTALVVGGVFLVKRNGPTEESSLKDTQQFRLPVARLILIHGDGAPRQMPRHMDLLSGKNIIGRDRSQVNLVIEHPVISRKHCQIKEEINGGFRIQDLNSRNGTFVNNRQVDKNGRVLQPDDEISFGPARRVVYQLSFPNISSKINQKTDDLTEDVLLSP
jgi:hypothetical protein